MVLCVCSFAIETNFSLFNLQTKHIFEIRMVLQKYEDHLGRRRRPKMYLLFFLTAAEAVPDGVPKAPKFFISWNDAEETLILVAQYEINEIFYFVSEPRYFFSEFKNIFWAYVQTILRRNYYYYFYERRALPPRTPHRDCAPGLRMVGLRTLVGTRQRSTAFQQ